MGIGGLQELIEIFILFVLLERLDQVANGHTVFDSRVEPNLKTLMKWAARDNDRTILYAAEIKIKL